VSGERSVSLIACMQVREKLVLTQQN